MSIFMPLTVTCPNCQAEFDVEVVESVNADRRPDLRDQILEGDFQIVTCDSCNSEVQLDPMFNYLDIGRGQWFSVQPADQMPDWIAQEDRALEVFADAYGANASGSAREIGDDLKPRLVFGWHALREKLRAADLGMDDVALECVKLVLIEETGAAPLEQGAELRLLGGEDGTFDIAWIDTASNTIVEGMNAPLQLYQDVAAGLDDWAQVTVQLQDGPFVDILKLFVGEGRVAAE